MRSYAQISTVFVISQTVAPFLSMLFFLFELNDVLFLKAGFEEFSVVETYLLDASMVWNAMILNVNLVKIMEGYVLKIN